MSAEPQALPDGWLTELEAAYLAEAASGKLVLEVGAYLGRSTVAMARTAHTVVSVDHHQGPPQDAAGPTTARFLANLNQFALGDKVIPVVAGFERVAAFLFYDFEMAFIDGAHDGISVLRDGRLAALHCRSGAPLYFHDYEVHVGVTSAVHELAKRWGKSWTVAPQTSIAVLYKG